MVHPIEVFESSITKFSLFGYSRIKNVTNARTPLHSGPRQKSNSLAAGGGAFPNFWFPGLLKVPNLVFGVIFAFVFFVAIYLIILLFIPGEE